MTINESDNKMRDINNLLFKEKRPKVSEFLKEITRFLKNRCVYEGDSYDLSSRDPLIFSQNELSLPDDLKGYFDSVQTLGCLKLYDPSDKDDIYTAIFAVKTSKDLEERSFRRKQFDFAKRMLLHTPKINELFHNIKDIDLGCGLFIFLSPDCKSYRLSLVESAKDRQKFKRYTFFVSSNLSNRTFCIRMTDDKKWKTLDDLRDTFSVERLNKEFYSKLSNWYFWALNKVHFPGCEQTKEGNAVPLIRFITRIIFVWFMKQKGLIPNELFQKNHVEKMLNDMDEDSSSYYKAILQNLFFATLNTEMKDANSRRFRKESNSAGYNKQYQIFSVYRYEKMFSEEGKKTFLDLMRNIPFLNGGLFSCLDDEKDLVDCFSDNPNHAKQLVVPNELFWTEESDNKHLNLSKIYDDNTKKNELLQGLIPLLSQYNFTIDESSKNDATVALDPELLGRVFENLLASYNPETKTTARKQSGSFYTPREIVDYMVEQSLTQHILTTAEKQNITLPEEDVRTLVSSDTSDDIALPQSIVQNKKMIVKAIESCTILDPACGSGAFPMGLLSVFVRVLGKLAPVKTDTELYERKLKLIQDCIYGVDIQPIAVQISKLRCFISLLADDHINEEEENRGIEPLPNLEMHFVAANSLINLEGPEDGSFIFPETEKIKNEMQDTARKLFSVKSRADKKQLQQKYSDDRQKLIDSLSNVFGSHDYDKLADWDPFDPMKFSPFFNPEWMFGINDGFDIIIGNPPYVVARKNQYIQYEWNSDLYKIFFERFIKTCLRTGAVLSYITPRFYLVNRTDQNMRRFLLNKVSIFKFVLCNPFEAVTENVITFVKNLSPSSEQIPVETYDLKKECFLQLCNYEKSAAAANSYYEIIFDSGRGVASILQKIEKESLHLADISKSKRGAEVSKKYLKESRAGVPSLIGEDMKRYMISWNQTFLPTTHKEFIRLKHFFNSPLIYLRRVDNCLEATISSSSFAFNKNVYGILLNSKFLPYQKFILALINSKVFTFYYKTKFTLKKEDAFPEIQTYLFEQLPIPIPTEEKKEHISKITNLVNCVLSKSTEVSLQNISELQCQIDNLVFSFYDFTEEEKAVIEQSFTESAKSKKGKGSAEPAPENGAKQEEPVDQDDDMSQRD